MHKLPSPFGGRVGDGGFKQQTLYMSWHKIAENSTDLFVDGNPIIEIDFGEKKVNTNASRNKTDNEDNTFFILFYY